MCTDSPAEPASQSPRRASTGQTGSRTGLSIGPLDFDVPFVQAALSGYSDLPMRRLARRYGAPYALNEVVLDKFVLQTGRKQRQLLRVV